MYYTSIPLVSERTHNRRWDAAKLRELRKRLDSGSMSTEEVDQVAADFLDSEIVDLASDWLGNTVRVIVPSDLIAANLSLRWCKNCLRNVLPILDSPCWSVLRLISQ
jgi:hypothetical protein